MTTQNEPKQQESDHLAQLAGREKCRWGNVNVVVYVNVIRTPGKRVRDACDAQKQTLLSNHTVWTSKFNCNDSRKGNRGTK